MKTVLMVGRAHPRFRERLAPHFQLVELASGKSADVTPEMAQSVVGATTFNTMPAALIDSLPNLKMVANFGVGYDGVDAAHAATKGVIVSNTPEVLDEEVADTAVGLLINTVRLLPQAENWLRAGKWVSEGPFRLSPLSLRGRHIGLYGLGRIGQQIAKRLEAFNLKISYHTRSPKAGISYGYCSTLKELAETVDTLIAIVPKTPDTHRTINTEILTALGKNGVMINVGRGWTVDENDLIAALRDGLIAAAGLDVFDDEPNVPAGMLEFDNVSLLPHIASASVVTRDAMADLVADNLIAYFGEGAPITPVPESGSLLKN